MNMDGTERITMALTSRKGGDMQINIDYYHELVKTESDPQKLKEELLKLLQTTVDIFLAAKRSEIETAKSGRVEHGVSCPLWYSEEDLYSWLKDKSYTDEVAHELAAGYAKNLQLAFEKGYGKGTEAGT